MVFSELATDLILSIFGHCDIASVVSTSQTCRYLHDLAFRKSVWLGLLDDLRERSIWDSASPPDLQSLGTDELVKLVKRLMTGPETRSPQHPGFRLEVSKEIILHPKFKHTPRGLDHVELLPSGRTVLVQRSGVLECWDVPKDRLVWRHTSVHVSNGVFDVQVIRFAAEELNKGDSLVVMVCQRNEDQRFVEIVNVDVRDGTHHLLLFARVPPSIDSSCYCDVAIRGTIAVMLVDKEPPPPFPTHSRRTRARTGPRTSPKYFIADWKEQTSFVLECSPKLPPQIALIPGHMILRAAEFTNGVAHGIHIISNDALNTHMVPAIGLDGIGEFNRVSADQLTRLSTLRSDQVQHNTLVIMWAHASPVHKDEYRIWNRVDNPARHRNIWCYQLSVPLGQQPRWRQQEVYPDIDGPGVPFTSTTYSGFLCYGFKRNRQQQIIRGANIFTATNYREFGEMDLTGCVSFPYTEPYSGAVTYLTDNTIVIRYFK